MFTGFTLRLILRESLPVLRLLILRVSCPASLISSAVSIGGGAIAGGAPAIAGETTLGALIKHIRTMGEALGLSSVVYRIPA